MTKLEWTKTEIEDALMIMLKPFKESGLEVDDPIVAKHIAGYALSLSETAYRKGQESCLKFLQSGLEK